MTESDYWYDNRHRLEEGMVFRAYDGTIVKLDRRVPGDGTKWYAATRYNGHWSFEDYTVEPGDLQGEPIDDRAVP